jgi:aldehyde:ferredoxin oxidoreductase
MARKLLRINMEKLTATYEDLPEKWSRWAGRALTSAITFEEVDPVGHPLGPSNKLIIAPGWVTGTPASPAAGARPLAARAPSPAVSKRAMLAVFLARRSLASG